MRLQRVREGESRMEMQSAKWAAEGTGKETYDSIMAYEFRVFCDVRAYVSCREYDGIPQSVRFRP